ncbi:alpha-amylase family glycosyl hydrolase [Reichenbachiella sp. MALMAid0571]|uniref:alpha-amylase family glycosyl hydrolase n=1 Tax=Reichenbachiella sp. MALMAid0571 TaxID=3143939 RepID=UPI0032DF2358
MTKTITKSRERHHEITYQVFVQSFADSNGDGIGDISGLTAKLDYLVDLGIEAIWLMPVHKSPSYHKYDVVDYKSVHPDYGTLEDFQAFLQKAHVLGIKVIIDFIINHTSTQHPWFIESSKGTDNPYRNYYIWRKKSDIEDEIYKKKISKDSDNLTQWHTSTGNDEMYYGFFWGGMPDLNHDNHKVFDEIVEIGRFWLENIGVDGFRLDAAKHIFGDGREKDNHKFWEKFRSVMQSIKPDVYIVGEVWDDVKAVVPYAKGIPSLFNFDLSVSIFDTLMKGDTLVDSKTSLFIKTLIANQSLFTKVNSTYVDAIFLSNHDQKRTASVLKNRKNKIKQAVIMLFTLPGRPYIYYGEELGMLGDKPDEYIREPFSWGNDSKFQTSWMTPKYNKNAKRVSVENQLSNPYSILNFYKNLIKLRKQTPVLYFGDLKEVKSGNNSVLGYIRSWEGQSVLILHNVGNLTEEFSLTKPYANYSRILFSFRSALDKTGYVTLSANGTILLMD